MMLFAAGFGTRMGALTRDRPKPLIRVAGQTLLDHALAAADAAGIACKVVNLHYRGEMIAAHLAGREDVVLSWERDRILDTGGGLRAALPLLGPGPVPTLNTDAVWTGDNPVAQLISSWDGGRMAALLLLGRPELLAGRDGPGDFDLGADGRIVRGGTLVYLGAQIIDGGSLYSIPDRVFSLNRVWDNLIAEGRAFGIIHRGGWCDVGHPEGIVAAEAMLRDHGHG
ncbi:MAG: nucleotidyltransferase family protein [Gemmobacter sp.]